MTNIVEMPWYILVHGSHCDLCVWQLALVACAVAQLKLWDQFLGRASLTMSYETADSQKEEFRKYLEQLVEKACSKSDQLVIELIYVQTQTADVFLVETIDCPDG